MCKKLFVLALMISLCMLTACGKSYLHDREMDIYEKLHRYYGEMEQYSATLELTVYSNKTQNTYIAHQKATDERLFMQISSCNSDLTVTTREQDGKVTTQFEGSDYTACLPVGTDSGILFLNRFFEAYYTSEDTALMVNGPTAGSVTRLETALPHANPQIACAVLTVDNNTLAPVSIALSDALGNTVITGVYTDFTYNDTSDF